MAEKIEIHYEAIVRGIDKISELSAKTQELAMKNDELRQKVQRFEEAAIRQESALNKMRRAILNFRKEIFAITFAIGAMAVGVKLLANSSDALTERLEALQSRIQKLLQPIGNFIAQMFGNKGQLSRGKQAELLGLESEVAALRGNSAEAVRKRLEAEEIKLTESIKSLSKERQEQFKNLFEERRRLIMEEQRLSELGLKRQIEIWKDFKREVVGAFRGGTSDVMFKFLQGEQQSGQDVMRSFTTGINRAVADAVSNALFTSLFQGGGFIQNFKDAIMGRNSTTRAVEQATEKLNAINEKASRIQDCICRTAENTGMMAGRGTPTMTIEPGKDAMRGVRMAAGITGAIATVAGLGAGFGGSGATGGINNPTGNNAGFKFGSGAFATGRTGGWVNRLPRIPKYAQGGEVPAILHSGEFVVNAQAASSNRDILRDINSKGKPVSGSGGNVFLIKANDAASFSQMLASPDAQNQLEIQVIRRIMSNGNLRRVIKDFAR